MRPIIGVTTSVSEDEAVLQLNCTYTDALIAAGAAPILLPPTDSPTLIAQYAGMIDGLLLSGGGDVDPQLFGETQHWEIGAISPVRDAFELALCQAVLDKGTVPILGICRGLQVLNVALGGDLYQDLKADFPGKTLAHQQKQRSCHPSHPVSIAPNTMLHSILGQMEVMVNSHHHQAIRRLPEGFISTASAPDGVTEAAELLHHPFCMGVQWHPERLWDQCGCALHKRIFSAFVDATSLCKKDRL